MATWKKVIVSGSSPELANATLSGDLTVTGGDIVLGTTSIFSGGDTAQLNNIDALDATTEATIESAIDTLSNLTAASSLVTVGTLGSGAISSGFGAIDIGTDTLNAGNTTVDTLVNDSTVAASRITGSFSGSFVGDGSNLTGVAQDIELLNAYGAATLHQTQDKFLVSDNGTEKSITFSNLEDSVFANVSGDATVAAGGDLSLGVTAITNQTNMTGDVADADELVINDGGSLKRVDFSVFRDAVFNDVSGDATVAAGGALTIAANSVALATDTTGDYVQNVTAGTGLTSTGATSGENIAHSLSVDAAQTQVTSVGALDAGSITSNFGSINNGASAITTTGTVSAATLSVSGNATVDGNLDVNGTVTTIQSANLLVKDRFILMNSGSAAGDGGIIVQTEGTASGSAFVYDDTGTRWGFQQGTKLAQDASTSTPDAYASAVVTSDDANYRKNGNIRVDSGEIYIYTE